MRRSEVGVDKTVPALLASDRTQVYVDEENTVVEGNFPCSAQRRIGTTADKPVVVVVRPDGYVGYTVKLVAGSESVDALNIYFGRFVTKILGSPLKEKPS